MFAIVNSLLIGFQLNLEYTILYQISNFNTEWMNGNIADRSKSYNYSRSRLSRNIAEHNLCPTFAKWHQCL